MDKIGDLIFASFVASDYCWYSFSYYFCCKGLFLDVLVESCELLVYSRLVATKIWDFYLQLREQRLIEKKRRMKRTQPFLLWRR